MIKLLATVPMRRGPASGSIHVPNIKKRNIHPDSANQRKNSVCKHREKLKKHVRKQKFAKPETEMISNNIIP